MKLQVKKETPHVEIFIYEIFLTVSSSIRFGTNVPSSVRNKLSTKSTKTNPKTKFKNLQFISNAGLLCTKDNR